MQTISQEGLSTELAAAAAKSVSLRLDIFVRNGIYTLKILAQIFLDVLFDAIQNILFKSEANFKKNLIEFQKLCCQSEYTYVLTQMLLSMFVENPDYGFVFKRLQQELSSFANSGVFPEM